MSKENKFKVGDKVKLITKCYGSSSNNPFFDDYNITGIVILIFNRNEYPVKVKWSNGRENVYNKEDLQLIKKQHMIKSDGKIKESESGFKKDNPEEKVRFDLIPYETLERLAKQFTGGAKKYGFENWKKANTPEQIHGFAEAAERHLLKWIANIDDGEDHAAAAMTNIMMYEWLTNHKK